MPERRKRDKPGEAWNNAGRVPREGRDSALLGRFMTTVALFWLYGTGWEDDRDGPIV